MLLMAGVLAVTDQRNVAPPAWLTAPLVGLLVVAIGVAFGFNAGYAINPARDLGPRLFTALAGWGRASSRRAAAGGGFRWWPVRGGDPRRLALRRLYQQAPRRAGGGR